MEVALERPGSSSGWQALVTGSSTGLKLNSDKAVSSPAEGSRPGMLTNSFNDQTFKIAPLPPGEPGASPGQVSND